MTRRHFHPPEAALRIVRTLFDAGYEAYFCGGCVRDSLMGCTPKDWDITTNASPDEIEHLFPKTVAVGKSFGVIRVVEDETAYEVATFRTDGTYLDGRRPESVRFGSAEEDVKRRDFTINALLYDMNANRILDYVGGVDDLETRLLRTVGDPRTRFLEDHLRLLRAIRFAARTHFHLEQKTFDAVCEMAGLVRTVSGERTGEELRRMLTEGNAHQALAMLEQTNLLLHLLPEVAVCRGMPQPEEFHPEGDVLTHTQIMLELMDEGTPVWKPASAFEREVLAFAVLLHDIGKPGTLSISGRIRFNEHDCLGASMSETVLERLKRPRRVIFAVRDIIGRHMHFANLMRMRKAKLRRYLQDPLFPLHLELHRLDCASSHRKMEIYDFALAAWQDECARPLQREPLLTGKDLLAMGYEPGPSFRQILDAVDDNRLEGMLSTPDEARAFVAERFPPPKR